MVSWWGGGGGAGWKVEGLDCWAVAEAEAEADAGAVWRVGRVVLSKDICWGGGVVAIAGAESSTRARAEDSAAAEAMMASAAAAASSVGVEGDVGPPRVCQLLRFDLRNSAELLPTGFDVSEFVSDWKIGFSSDLSSAHHPRLCRVHLDSSLGHRRLQ